MVAHIGMVIAGVLVAAPPTTPSLSEVLQKLGAAQGKYDTTETCSYKESSVIEELDSDGEQKGKLRRIYAIVRRSSGTDRKLLEEEKSGDISSMFTSTPNDPTPEERKQQRGPFHPEEQPLYRFALVEAKPDRLVLSYEPLKKHEKKMKGTAELDPETFALRSMTLAPSKLPTLLDEFQLHMRFAQTPCGLQPVKLDMKGVGGLLFVKKRFRTSTRYLDYAAPAGQAKGP